MPADSPIAVNGPGLAAITVNLTVVQAALADAVADFESSRAVSVHSDSALPDKKSEENYRKHLEVARTDLGDLVDSIQRWAQSLTGVIGAYQGTDTSSARGNRV